MIDQSSHFSTLDVLNVMVVLTSTYVLLNITGQFHNFYLHIPFDSILFYLFISTYIFIFIDSLWRNAFTLSIQVYVRTYVHT